MSTMTDGRLSRLRWGARGALVLGIAASLVANVLHAHGDIVARGIAAWPPVALLIAFELVVRVPVARAWQSWTRAGAAGSVAAIGAWLSYWHMVAVCVRYGETGHGAEYLMPLTVDGLALVAAISLVELAAVARRRAESSDEPSAVDPTSLLNEAQRAAVELVDQLGLTSDQLAEVAYYFAGDRDAEPWPWERSSAVAPTSPGMPPVNA